MKKFPRLSIISLAVISTFAQAESTQKLDEIQVTAEEQVKQSLGVSVVTAKDAESSQAILKHFDLDRHISGIIGEAHDKALAVSAICLGRGIDPGTTLFIDDNIVNCVKVSSTGATVNWAAWGWTSLAHFEVASIANLAKLEMADMINI